MTVHTAGQTWSMRGSAPGDLTVEASGKTCSLRLADASEKTVTPYQTGFKTGVKVALRGFRHEGTQIDLEIDLFICLEGREEELVCELIAREDKTHVLECLWPAGLETDSFDATVVPFMQGMFLPKDWAKKVWLYDTLSYGRGLYMPWWGHQQGDAALLVLLETPDDGGCRFEHPAGGPTRIQPRWVHSLGKLRYPRRPAHLFLRQGQLRRPGQAVSPPRHRDGAFRLDKGKRSPAIHSSASSSAVPSWHTSILYHIQPESQYYHKDDPAKNDQLVHFDDRVAQFPQTG